MGDHLTEAELLDLADPTGHVAGCAECAAAIAEAQAGLALLQAAAPVEPAPDLAAVIAALPRRPRRRLLLGAAALVPVAGALAAGVLVLTTHGTTKPPAESSLRSGAIAAPKAAVAARSVAGPPAAVVALLRRAGLRARAEGPGLVVATGSAAGLDSALRGRAPGPVRIELRP